MNSRETGHADRSETGRPSATFFVVNAIAGLLIGLAIVLTGAPFWTFYVSPLAMLPIWLAELRRQDRSR